MGSITREGSIEANLSSYDTSNYSYASVSSSYPLTNAYAGSTNTTYGQVTWKTGSGAETYLYFRFDLSSIPENATITSVSATSKAYVNTTSSSRVTTRQMQLCSGTTLKGSPLTISTSTSEQMFTSTGTWTRNELDDAGIRYYVKRGTSNTSSTYNLRIYGATIVVEYEYQEVTYTITVSGGEPSSSEVLEGSEFTARCYDTDKPICKDNGTNVTDRLILGQLSDPSYVVSQASGVSYGFSLNSNNYYESNNQGRSSSTALSIVTFDLPVECTVDFKLINYAESTYDFGLLSNIDTSLTTASSADAANVYWSGKNNNSSSVQTVSYTIPAGEHYIYVKYFKDNYTDDYNDSLQFRVEITPNEQYSTDPYWGYTISAVTGEHTIVFSPPNKLYFKDNGNYVEAQNAYKKVNGSWVLQEDLSAVFASGVNYVKG